MIFLDAASGTKPYPEVVEVISDVLTDHWGNASSVSSYGYDAMQIIDDVTKFVADDICCEPDELIWTSGACEANSLAIKGVLESDSRLMLWTTYLEHTSTEMACKNIRPNGTGHITNNELGEVDLITLNNYLKEATEYGCLPFVSICAANSEIGVIQDIAKISEIVHKYNGVIHVDATQLYPWSRINVHDMGIDLMSVSGQKLHATKGVGFLYVNKDIKISPIIYGSQNNGLRGGTYATHLIAGFGKALETTRRNNASSKVAELRDMLVEKLSTIDNIKFNGSAHKLPNNISLTIDGVNAESLVTQCDIMGVIIGKGSACQSYEPIPSQTLISIGLTEEQALSTIRITLDEFNTKDDIETAANIIINLVKQIRSNTLTR